MAQTSRRDWIDAGIAILKAEGERRITIASLCKRMKRTKGAFYHHFKNREAFLAGVLDHWEEIQTTVFIETAQQLETTTQRLDALNRLTMDADFELERCVRIWAYQDPLAHKALERVDKRRVEYLTMLYHTLGLSQENARVVGEMEYATLIGATMMVPPLDERRLQAAAAIFQAGIKAQLSVLGS